MIANRSSRTVKRNDVIFSVVAALMVLLTIGCNSASVPNGGGGGGGGGTQSLAPKIGVTGASAIGAGVCVRYDLQLLDQNGTVWNGGGSYSSFSVGPVGKVFSDNSCAVSVSNVPVDSSGAGVVYVKDTVRENISLAVSSTGGALTLSSTKAIAVLGGDPTTLLLSATLSNVTNVCVPVSVKTQDAYLNLTGNHPAMTVSLNKSGISQAALYSDSTCLNTISNVTIAAGVDSATFYAQSLAVGSLNILASAALMTPDDIDLTFVSGTQPRLVLGGSSANILANSCSQVTVESRRADGTPLVVSGGALNVSIGLLTGANVNFYSESNCLIPLGVFQILDGSYSSALFVKTAQAPQAVSLSANATGYVSGAIGMQWIPIPATKLVFQGTPASIAAGSCGLGQVALLDASNNAAFVSNPISIQMQGAGTTLTDFYATNDCTGAVIATLNLPACGVGPCNNVLPFSFKPKLVGTASLTAASTGLTSGTATVSVTAPIGAPMVLSLNRVSTSLLAGSCLQYDLKSLDQYGNPVTLFPAGLGVALTSTSSSGLGQFFSDANCLNSMIGIGMPAGSNSATFYYQNPRAETALITAQAGALTAQSSLSLSVNSPAKLVWNNVPASMVATRCSTAVSVRQTDNFDNNTNVAVGFNLVGANGMKFYADSSCTQQINSSTIAANTTASAPFYFSGPFTGATQLTAIATSPASITQAALATVNFTTAPAVHVALSCTANDFLNPNCAPLAAGVCRPVFAASLDNTNALYAPVGGALNVAMSSTSANGGLFYSNSVCTVPLVGNNVSIDASANPKAFYVKNTIAENFSIVGTPSTGTAGSLALTSTGAVPSKLVIASNVGPATFLNDSCAGPFQVDAQDSFGNVAVFPVATSIQFNNSTLNGNGIVASQTFFSDNACAASAPMFQANASFAQFYVKSALAGTLNVLATASGVAQGGTRALVITDGARIAFRSGTTEVASINFQSVVVNTHSATQTLEVKNMSSGDSASVSGLVFSGQFQRVAASSTCPTTSFTLAAQQSCTLVLDFVPTAIGSASGSLVANYSSTSIVLPKTTTVTLSGTGVSAPFTTPVLNPSSVTFSNIQAGTNYTYTGTLTNPNYYAITFTGIVGPSAPYTISAASPCSNTFPFTLAANASCNVTVTFAPTAAGSFNSSVQYQFTNPNTASMALSSTMSLIGSAITVAQAAPYLSLSSINFGTAAVGSSTTQTMNLVNPNNSAITVSAVQNIAAPFTISLAAPCSNTFPFTMAANASCVATVTYAPTATGTVSGSVRYSSSAGQTNSTTLSGQGSTIPAAILSLSPSNYNFGSVALNTTSGPVSFTLSNLGNQAIDSIVLDNYTLPFSISNGTCSGTVLIGQSCTFTVSFAPTASASYSATVRLRWRNVASNTTSQASSALTLSGTGGAAQSGANLVFDTSSIYFGYLPINQSMSYYILVTNYGQTNATNLALTGSGSNSFWVNKGTCTSSLAAGASCWINTGFQPTSYGYVTANIGMSYVSGATTFNTSNVALSGVGY